MIIPPIPARKIWKSVAASGEKLPGDQLARRGRASCYPREPMLRISQQKNRKGLNIERGKAIWSAVRM